MSARSKPDPGAQQRLAADPNASVWVAASAGTGKTKVLTDRVLALLLAGSEPARILCLTFTKAAAAEMAIRIGARLSAWATASDTELRNELAGLTGDAADADLLDRARQLFARVLDAPGGMRIETIHAFCQGLLRRFPLEAGIPPHFQVMEERSTAEAMERAVAQVLDRARDGKPKALKTALDTVTQLTGEEGFIELVGKLGAQRGRVAALRDAGDAQFEVRLRERFGLRPGETPDSIVRQASKEGTFGGDALKRAARALCASGNVSDQKAGRALSQWLGRVRGRVHGFDEYCAAYFTKDGGRRARLATKAVTDIDPRIAEDLAREAERLAAVRARRDAARLAEATAALIRLAGAVLDAYAAHKAARALLDFDDLVLKAKALLQRPGVAPWVLFKLDGGIDHILIDEAQDTNPDQWDVVAALAEEFFAGEGARDVLRTVFAVGDPKQSIFSFQRADPGRFVAMREHFRARVEGAGRKWQPLALELSFRSVAAVLQTVDAVFADQRVAAGVAFAGATIRHEPYRLGAAGMVELWPPVGPEPGEPPTPWDAPLSQARLKVPRARLAEAIAATVKSWIDTGETLESCDRPVQAGDILVLVRRRDPFVGALVRALKERDVPVAGVDRMVLADQLAVQDLVALAQFLLLPADDLTLATVLKGPLYGIDDDLLFTLAWRRPRSLWDALRRRAGENPKFRFAAEELVTLLARADFVPPFELFAEVLGARGGRRKILARLGPEAGDPLDELLAAALAFERDHGPSLQGFLHWLVLGELEVKRDLNNEAGRDELRVITVHGAKGLQAPIVFLPDTLQVPDRPHGVVWTDDGLPLWLAQGDAPAAREAIALADRRRDEEYRRLLYVALTRAEDRLYVCGWNGKRKSPDDAWYPFVQAGLKAAGGKSFVFDTTTLIGDNGWIGEGLRLVTRQRGKREERPPRAAAAPIAGTLPSWAVTPPPPEPAPPKPLQPSRPSRAEPPTRSPMGADDGHIFRKGLIVHRLLQSLPLVASAQRAAAATRFLARPVLALDPSEQAAIAAETLTILAEPDFAMLFGPDSEAEVPVVGLVGERAVSGRIDRLVVTDSEVAIVDYKTMRPVPRTESEVPEAYLDQLAAYRAALARVYPGKTVRCALLWTEGPKLMWASDAALAGRAE
ncbi:MAG: double-strand break repair helicase AddA [Alphaproteobacteria bacterium]|nr:double-strand break repair helicase AddA [Alphaproteobacteria bacterium]